MPYAENTSVSVEKTKGDIERTLARYGADQFMYGWNQDQAMIGFAYQQKMIKILLSLPDRNDAEFQNTPSGRRKRDGEAALQAWEQACKSRWRALLLVIKAKLEAIEVGVSTFENEFLAYIALPDGGTVGEWALDAIPKAIATGKMPKLLPA
jgi:hypothetical protein